jgi:predicted dehydrogenase
MNAVRVGIIGCGQISPEYLSGLKPFDVVDVIACADLDGDRARALADESGVARACSPRELLEDPDVELVVNLTPPVAHATVSLEAIAAGKHVYSEKPLAVTVSEARAVLAAARDRGLLVGCAPDTFLGASLQTARKLIDDGAIGTPIAASAFLCEADHHEWHGDPRYLFASGGGPMLDTAPYYVTALIALLGPVRRVAGMAGSAPRERAITRGALRGTPIPVQVETHVAGTLELASGAIATMAISWDVWASTLPQLEIYGTDASLSAPDPNWHSGPIRLRAARQDEWEDVALTHDADVARSIGVVDMADAMRSGRPHRASGAVALHALDVMCAFEESSASGRHMVLDTTCERPPPLPAGRAEFATKEAMK